MAATSGTEQGKGPSWGASGHFLNGSKNTTTRTAATKSNATEMIWVTASPPDTRPVSQPHVGAFRQANVPQVHSRGVHGAWGLGSPRISLRLYSMGQARNVHVRIAIAVLPLVVTKTAVSVITFSVTIQIEPLSFASRTFRVMVFMCHHSLFSARTFASRDCHSLKTIRI